MRAPPGALGSVQQSIGTFPGSAVDFAPVVSKLRIAKVGQLSTLLTRRRLLSYFNTSFLFSGGSREEKLLRVNTQSRLP